MSETWYTLAVVDEDGSITGQRGAMLAPSRPLALVDDWQRAKIGEAVPDSKMPPHPPNLLEFWLPDPDDMRKLRHFSRWYLAEQPASAVPRWQAIEAWERVS